MIETLKDIIRKVGMSTRPEYYSGRGATTSDLNDTILFAIHKDIKTEFGEKAAKNFVKMIDKTEVLSATTFLNELYRLYDMNWKYVKNTYQDKHGMQIAKDENGNYDVSHGVVSMAFALTGGMRDDTAMIKNHFLMKNGVKLKEEVIFCNYGRY